MIICEKANSVVSELTNADRILIDSILPALVNTVAKAAAAGDAATVTEQLGRIEDLSALHRTKLLVQLSAGARAAIRSALGNAGAEESAHG